MRYIRSFTLKELSLESILAHLDLFIYHKDRIPQRHIDFLHRLYSKECYNKYNITAESVTEDSKTEECLLWLLSSHNKNVFLKDINQNIIERLQIVGSGITSLTLQGTRVEEDVLDSVISCVPHLLYLNLCDTWCTDSTLLCIQKTCPNLVTLNLESSEVTDNGMVNLCGNSMCLKDLNILYTAVYSTGLNDILLGMPSLQRVTYYNMATSFHEIYKEAAYSNPNKLNFNLTELVYDYDSFDRDDHDPRNNYKPRDVIWTWTVLCPNVEKVHILSPVKPDALTMCSRFSHLKEFEYKSKQFDRYYIGSLEQLTPLLCKTNNLTTLKLSHAKLPSVRLIDCLTSVKNLYLDSVTFTDFNKDEIVSKTTNLNSLTLKNLYLDMTCATYKFIALLFALSKNVTELVISMVNISYRYHFVQSFTCDLIDIILNSMKNLIEFSLDCMEVPVPSSLFKLFDIPTVKRIHIDRCCHEDRSIIVEPISCSTDTCTLAWRSMNDPDKHEDDDDIHDHHTLDFYVHANYDTEDMFRYENCSFPHIRNLSPFR